MKEEEGGGDLFAWIVTIAGLSKFILFFVYIFPLSFQIAESSSHPLLPFAPTLLHLEQRRQIGWCWAAEETLGT